MKNRRENLSGARGLAHPQLVVGPWARSFSLGLGVPTYAAGEGEDDLEGSFPGAGSVSVS